MIHPERDRNQALLDPTQSPCASPEVVEGDGVRGAHE